MATIYLDDQPMDGKRAVCEFLGIQENSIPNHRRKEFKVPVTYDADGHPRYKRSIGGKPEYLLFVKTKGRSIKVRLADVQFKDKNQNFTYEPKSTFIMPAEGGSVLMNDDLEFIFWFLRPMNEDSPFYKPGAKTSYKYVDNDADARKENDVEELRIRALSLIFGNSSWSPSKLKMLAKGLNIGGVDDMSTDLVKTTLKKYAQQSPGEFLNKADSREVIYSGKVQDAIDKGILKLDSMNGMKRWYLQGKEIRPVPFGADERLELDTELTTNWHLYAEQINAGLEGRTIASTLNSPEYDNLFTDEIPDAAPKAELPREILSAIKEALADDKQSKKIKALAALDPATITNYMQKKAYDENKELIDAYLATQQQPA